MKQRYPHAKLYFVLETNPCPGSISEETRLKLIGSTHRIANHFNVDCIDLYDVHRKWRHPDVQGQKSISDQVLDFLMTEKR